MPSFTGKKSPCRLVAFGAVNALGRCRDQIEPKLYQGDTSGIVISDAFIPGRSVPVGMVQGIVTEVEARFSHLASRNTSLLLMAYRQIEDEVRRYKDMYGSHRIGVVLGSSTSGIMQAESALERMHQTGILPDNYYYSAQEMGAVSEYIRAYADISGPCYTVSTACSSSAKVFQSAKNLLQNDICDAVIVGGADSLCKLTLNGFASLELLSDSLSNPFSVNRSGINIGESAALFLMTKQPDGVQLLGVGESSDAFHISSPDPDAKGAIRALQQALQQAAITADEVDYINLHGTGTLHNDASEAKAVSAVFGNTVCSSTKPLVGHTLGASGATEAGFCWYMLTNYLNNQEGILPIPPHHYDGNTDTSIPRLHLAPKNTHITLPRKAVCVSNSFGFGGSNCAVVLEAQR